jgi:hypothetical protein
VLKYKHNNNISQKWGISGGKMTKRKKTIVAAFAILGIAVVGLAAGVYAKYISTITRGAGEATVAKWAFETDNANSTITCKLAKTYNANTLTAGKIAPGTSGKCPISISNANSEVGVTYEIKPKAITDAPKNLKFYKDEAHQNAFSESATISGTLAPKAAANTIYVYWYWPYETTDGDTDDTTDGKAAKTMTVTFDITGTQVRPE